MKTTSHCNARIEKLKISIIEEILTRYTVYNVASAVSEYSDEEFYEFFIDLYKIHKQFNDDVEVTTSEVDSWISACLNEIEDKMMEDLSFHNDEEKMRDFLELSKEEFLSSYSYLTEKEYEATKNIILRKLSEI